MQKTESHTSGVEGILFRARQYNPEIGFYKEHYINEEFGFSVKLSNGVIKMSIEIAQDYESRPSGVTSDRVDIVAKTFRKI